MIIEFEFEFNNFRSFKDDQFFSMERPKNFGFDNDSIIINDKKMLNLSRVAAIYGANAAGKTNFLDALRRLRFIITRGRLIQFPFVSQRNKSSRFNLLFITKLGMKYRYKIEL